MEHSTSAVNWQPVNRAKAPGELARTSLAHVARGADAVGYFQWRASAAGAEKFHSALVPHAGTDTRVWREVSELGALLHRAGDLAGTRVEAEVALLFDWSSWWACDQDSHPSNLVRYATTVLAVHRALWSLGVTTDVVHPAADLGRYRLVLAPCLYLVEDGPAAALLEFARAGGHVVLTYFSGIVDADDHIRLGGYPGAFRELLGLRTEEFHPLVAGEQVALDDGSTGTVWTEMTHLDGAQATARYLDGPVAGHPAVTVNEIGSGTAWYLGTALDDASLQRVLGRVCERAGARATPGAGAGVDVTRRRGDDRSFLVVVNHTGEAAEVPARGMDLVTGGSIQGAVTVPAGGVALVREET